MRNTVTSTSKKPGQNAILYHYCGLSRFFLNQTLDSLCPGNLDEVFHVPIPSWEKSVPTDESQHHCHMEKGGATRTK